MAIEISVQPLIPEIIEVGQGNLLQYNLSNYATITGLNSVSGELSERIESTGSYLYSLINISSAGVSSLNGQSGIISILGTGNINVTTQGQTIFISGDGSSQTINLVGLISTGDADLRYYPLYDNPSGYLNTLSGLSIQYIVDVSGALSLRLIETGSILDNRITSLSGYLDSNFATISYTNYISGELSSQILAGGGSGVISLNTLAGTINLLSSSDEISFTTTGNNLNINNKPQNLTIYRDADGQITGVQKNVQFIGIYRDSNSLVTGVYYNDYFKTILYDNLSNITGVKISYF